MLDLHDNAYLMCWPQNQQLTSLKMSLIRNKIMNIPAWIGQLTSLTELHLYGNQRTSLPAEIGQLKSLENLTSVLIS